LGGLLKDHSQWLRYLGVLVSPLPSVVVIADAVSSVMLFGPKIAYASIFILNRLSRILPIPQTPPHLGGTIDLDHEINVDNCKCYCHNQIRMVGPEENRAIDRPGWTVEGLIAAADRVISSDPKFFAHPDSESNKELNVRLIRDYVVREFIPRPERVGREARFGLDHLVQLLAVRVLLRSQRWSLPAIKASFATTSTEELLNGLLAQVRSCIESEYRAGAIPVQGLAQTSADIVRTPHLNPAQLLIEQFKATRKSPTMDAERTLSNKTARATPAPASRATQRTGGMSSRLHVELEPWCEVVIDVQRVKSLTPKEIERLGEALKSRLHDETAR